MQCLGTDTLAQFVGRALPTQGMAEFQAHLDQCPSCFELVRVMVASAPGSSGPGSGERVAAGSWHPPPSFDEFQILRPLGRGSMGQVYLARDRHLDRRVAVKFISGETLPERLRQRFLREARALARVSHPNVVTAYRYGEAEGRPYLVSEFIRGQSLNLLPKPVPWREALRVACRLAQGLAAAHKNGILHRDIKPANIVLADSGEVKLLDFGLAKSFDAPALMRADTWEAGAAPALPGAEQAALTGTGALVGTPLYMAPESWRGEPASPQADVYSLGAVIHELLLGAPPYVADHLKEARQRIARQPVAPLATQVPEIDRRFAAVVDRCLQRDPAARYASGAELSQALDALDALEQGPRRAPRWPLPLLGLGAIAAGLWSLWSLEPQRVLPQALVPAVVRRAQLRLAPPVTYAAGVLSKMPTGCALSDLNGDGKLDVIVAKLESNDQHSGALAVLLGNGDGTLRAASESEVGLHARPVVVADFDGDGRRDVATVGSIGQRLDVLRGQGDGTFARSSLLSLCSNPQPYPEALAAAVLTTRREVDLVVAQAAANSVGVWLGDGTGGFRQAIGSPIAVGNTPRAIATGDLDHDGRLDVVTANNDGTVSMLLGHDDGTFQAARTTAVGSQLAAVTVAVLDPAQTWNDLVVTDPQAGVVHVLLNRGSGNFKPPATYRAGRGAHGLAIGDVNGDGIADIVVANGIDDTLSVLAGRGDRTFAEAQTVPLPPGPEAVALGDLNGDGRLDVVVTQVKVNLISVLLNGSAVR